MLRKLASMTTAVILVIMSFSIQTTQGAIDRVLADNFESGATPSTTGAYNSELFYNSTGSSGMPAVSYGNHLHVVEGIGYNDTKGLHMHCDETIQASTGKYRGAWLTTREFTLESGEVAILRYKFKILNKGTYTGSIARFSCIGSDADSATPLTMRNNLLDFKNGSGNFEYSLDEWYTIECVITTEDTDNVKLQMTNENNEILGHAKITRDVSGPIHTKPINFIGNQCDLAEAVMDDVSLAFYNSTSHAPAIIPEKCSIITGAEDVDTEGEILVAFDQMINTPTAGQDVKLYNANNPSDKANFTITPMLSGFTINLNVPLKGETEYILDLAGISNTGGLPLAGNTQISFTTAPKKILKRTDDFETSASPNSSGEYQSDIFLNVKGDSTNDSTRYNNIHILYDVGYNGTKGFQFLQNVRVASGTIRHAFITTREIELEEDDVAILEYKINIKNFGEGNAAFRLGGINGSGESSSIFKLMENFMLSAEGDESTQERFYCQTDTWYTVTLKIAPNQQTGYLIDESGNIVLKADREIDAGNSVRVRPIYLAGSTSDSPDDGLNREVIIDDVNLYIIAPDIHPMVFLSEKSTPNNSVFVTRKVDIRFEFNQPVLINAGEEITLYDGQNPVFSEYAVRYDDLNSVVVSIAQFLNSGTEYELKIDDIKGMAGSQLTGGAVVAFTIDAAMPFSIEEKPDILVGGTVNEGIKTVTVKNEKETRNATFVIAMYTGRYSDRLIGAEVFKDYEVLTGENTFQFAVQGSYTNVTSVKIFALDNLEDINPLMDVCKITE